MNVISNKNLPAKLPIFSTAAWITILHYWNAPEWLWGVMGFCLLLIWGFSVYHVITQKQIDIMQYWQGDEPKIKKPTFEERMNEAKMRQAK